ncbi:MAG: hypothetical protein QNJ12_15105 [Ilumatobacter sp.]|uniref:hypothetical protein n=1 Tax=Ilumatobacter sp. TaxID=1967498 RepID=UPI002639D8AB|nr:hypothetical protein [Ilumatobacter sp.]MDJ0770128.1 hypothetical protein [Ilumatobacter sp.]
MSARTFQPAATFTASRRDLAGDDALLGAAEIARTVCRRASQRVSLLAVTPDRMRRIDGWITDDAFVTHAVSPSDDDPVVGSVSAGRDAADLVMAIADSLAGGLPRSPATAPVEAVRLTALSPVSLGPGIDAVLVLSLTGGGSTERWAVGSIAHGLVAGRVDDPATPCDLHPTSSAELEALVGRLLRRPTNDQEGSP